MKLYELDADKLKLLQYIRYVGFGEILEVGISRGKFSIQDNTEFLFEFMPGDKIYEAKPLALTDEVPSWFVNIEKCVNFCESGMIGFSIANGRVKRYWLKLGWRALSPVRVLPKEVDLKEAG